MVVNSDPDDNSDNKERSAFAKSKRSLVFEQDSIVSGSTENRIRFKYRGDLFNQRGNYADSVLYLSRLPKSSSNGSLIHRSKKISLIDRHSEHSTKLNPVSIISHFDKTKKRKSIKIGRKRQCAQAIDSMASNYLLHETLLNDGAVPNLVALCRTKDLETLNYCISALCHISCGDNGSGREEMLRHGCIPLLHSVLNGSTSNDMLINNSLATLANLSIEDNFESSYVKEKALDLLILHKDKVKQGSTYCMSVLLNLTCPTYSFPRIEDVIICCVTVGKAKNEEDYELLSQSLYNLSCTKMNHPKLTDHEVYKILGDLALYDQNPSVQFNAVYSMWNLAQSVSSCQALITYGSLSVLIVLLKQDNSDKLLERLLLVLVTVASYGKACYTMMESGIFDAIPQIAKSIQTNEINSLLYKLAALLANNPIVLKHVSQPFLNLLLHSNHDGTPDDRSISCYVLILLSGILYAQSEEEEEDYVITETDNAADMCLEESLENFNSDKMFHLFLNHITYDVFEIDSVEDYLQAVLLYNYSFTCDKMKLLKNNEVSSKLTRYGTQNSREDIKFLASGILLNLCQENAAHEKLMENGLLKILKNLVLSDCANHCLDVICIIFDANELRYELYIEIVEELFPILVSISRSSSILLHKGCIRCFSRFAEMKECRLTMVKNGLIASLTTLVCENDPYIWALCVTTYSNLAYDFKICNELINNGIVKSLISLSAAPEEAVRQACAATFCNLSFLENNIRPLVQKGILPALLVISCVKSNDLHTRRLCMKSIMNLIRNENNISQMCREGLTWAFVVFSKLNVHEDDFIILANGFCQLSFFKNSRVEICKVSTLNVFLKLLSPGYSRPIKITILKGVCNLLIDPLTSCLPLLHANILHYFKGFIKDEFVEGEDMNDNMDDLVSYIMLIIYENEKQSHEIFLDTDGLSLIMHLLANGNMKCKLDCTYLLLKMSLNEKTVTKMCYNRLVERIISVITKEDCSPDMLSYLIQTLYNLSCNSKNAIRLCNMEIVGLLASVTSFRKDNLEILKACASVLRNFSCIPECHDILLREKVTVLITKIFGVKDRTCKEDCCICLCNLALGNVNTSCLLAQGALEPFLWLSSQLSNKYSPLCSAVFRKICTPPGNSQYFSNVEAISSLATMLEQSTNLYVAENCIAACCLLSRKKTLRPMLASFGILSTVIEMLQQQSIEERTLMKQICADLLANLAQYMRPDVASEKSLTSSLFNLLESQHELADWKSDRKFLQRYEGGPLPLLEIFTERKTSFKEMKIPVLSLFPIIYDGYQTHISAEAKIFEIEPLDKILPPTSILKFESNSNSVPAFLKNALGKSRRGSRWKKIAAVEFTKQEMFPKNRKPFQPLQCTEKTRVVINGPQMKANESNMSIVDRIESFGSISSDIEIHVPIEDTPC